MNIEEIEQLVRDLDEKVKNINCKGVSCDDCPGSISTPCTLFEIQTKVSVMIYVMKRRGK